LVVLSLLAGGVLPRALRADGAVEMTVYSSSTCETCALVKRQVLDPLQQAYGDRLVITVIEVSQTEGLRQLEAVEERFGVRNNPLPVIVLGDELLASDDIFALQDMLTERLEARLGPAASASALPTVAPTPVATPTASAALTPQGAALHVAYVEKDGCSNCARALLALQSVQPDYPGLVLHTLNDVRDADLVEAMGEYLGLPQERRLIAPSVFAGEQVLVGDEITTSSLRVLFDRYAATGAPAFWDDLDVEAGKTSIIARFKKMGPLAVVAAALLDGINPCAFATVLFFVSYLAVSRRGRREMLAVGLAFTLGVFVTYLAVGLGAMSLLKLASLVRIVGTVLYGLMALSCFVLAGMSAYDYVLARRGKLHEMSLNLPDRLRERIKGRIRAASGAFVGAAFGSGLMVSILELACTGQVYLPTISFVVGIPEMRASAVLYLVLYNVVFVLPLLVILLLAVYGVSASKFEAWFVKNVARTKLVMTVLFLILGGLLVAQLLTL
jgi:cytochrome c biogenesis protein CcdA